MTKDEHQPVLLMRDELYALVWSAPMLKIAARFNVSSSYMARVCTHMNVPRPERGYWAKLAAGMVPPILPLPDSQPGDQLAWSRGGTDIEVARPLPRPPSEIPKRRTKSKTAHTTRHPLVEGARGYFEASRFLHETGYLKPDKKVLIDLVVTKAGLDKALTFADQLFSLFEEGGYRVVFAPKDEHFCRAEVDEHEVPRKKPDNRYYNNLWSPWRCTVVYVGTVAIGLTIIEMAEEVEVRYINGKYVRVQDYVPPKRSRYEYQHTWTTQKDYPTGRLCLQAYSPYPRARWVKRWQAAKTSDLGSRIETIVKELEQAASDIARLVEEGERQAKLERQKWEAEQERWRHEEEERRANEARKKSRDELLQIINDWGRATRIEQFFWDAEQRAADLGDDERLRLLERLKHAREMAGSIDALKRFMMWRAPDER
jgi:hypothetical protein